MSDLSRAAKILIKLKEIGVRLAIDDFGTGFSSLNYLKNLPFDTIKIDKSFILDMCINNKDKAVVKTIIELGHNLDCEVVAEGIENLHTLESLKALHIDRLQGFFFSKPLPAQELAVWLASYQAKPNALKNIK